MKAPEFAGLDPDRFDGWALWSGTSFAAPRVAAAIAQRMADRGETARTAAEVVTAAPGLLRLPDLGVVVNVV